MGAPKLATPADHDDLPDNIVGELLNGEVYLSPRPAGPHARASSALGGSLFGPFQRGRGGPGGWFILYEPELHLGEEVLVPDLAGWRRERVPELPRTAAMTIAPDWVCEVLSPRTASVDRIQKRRVYAREKVAFMWHIDPIDRVLTAYTLDGADSRELGTWGGDEDTIVRVAPFDAIELDLTTLWAPRPADL